MAKTEHEPRLTMVKGAEDVALEERACAEAILAMAFPPSEREALTAQLLLQWYHRGALDALDKVRGRLVT
jgi:hypothetical protein